MYTGIGRWCHWIISPQIGSIDDIRHYFFQKSLQVFILLHVFYMPTDHEKNQVIFSHWNYTYVGVSSLYNSLHRRSYHLPPSVDFDGCCLVINMLRSCRWLQCSSKSELDDLSMLPLVKLMKKKMKMISHLSFDKLVSRAAHTKTVVCSKITSATKQAVVGR